MGNEELGKYFGSVKRISGSGIAQYTFKKSVIISSEGAIKFVTRTELHILYFFMHIYWFFGKIIFDYYAF